MNAGIDNGGNTMSFWRLLKHYSIRIPAIRRRPIGECPHRYA